MHSILELGERFRQRLRLLVAVLIVCVVTAAGSYSAIADDDEADKASAEDRSDDARSEGDRGGEATQAGFGYGAQEYREKGRSGAGGSGDSGGTTGRDRASSHSRSREDVVPDVPSTPVPDFITRLQRAPDHGDVDCVSGVCRAARGSCTAAPDYTVFGGEVLATPRSSGPREAGSVTFESITQDTRSGAETSNGYSCAVPSARAPQTAGASREAADEVSAEPVTIIVTQSDFAELPVKPSVASAGPDRGWLPTGMVNVLHAEHEVQTLQTEVLGTPVAVRAIPTSYHWDLGDGNTITTSKPGKPYPSEEVSAKYSGEGWYDVTLTTTFAGQFSVDGGEWQDIDGTIEVASEPIALYSKSLESRLVNGDVPVDEGEDPWVPERSPETEGPKDPNARHREI